MNIIGITSGDPAGIGLEVTFKALPSLLGSARWVLFTDREVFDRNYGRFGSGLPCRWIGQPAEATDDAVLFAIDTGNAERTNGERAIAYLTAASDAAIRRHIHAIVTAPVSKASIGSHFKGQTEFLAGQAQVSEFAMAFFAPTFKVVLATVHMSLREALERISAQQYVHLIQFVSRVMAEFGFFDARIAVAGINPHAGEQGMFGRKEIDLLAPAVKECAALGISVSGPHSADSLYYRAHSGEFDIVIAPYHDQGLIPVKLIAHGNSTNVTLGLPYVRTSPDHGTAFAIAGQGLADPSGMQSAMRCALDLLSRASITLP